MDQTKTSASSRTQVTPPPADENATQRRPSRAKRFLGVIGAVVVVLGSCYLGGYLHGRSEVVHLTNQLDLERKAADAQRVQLAERLEAERQRASVLEARRNLDLALAALDARNFGIAEQQIKQAAERLNNSRLEARVSQLVKTLESFHLVATEDLGPQRKQLSDWIGQLDQLLPTNHP